MQALEKEQKRREEKVQKRRVEEEKNRREEEERNCRKNADHTQAMEEMRRRLVLLNTKPAESGAEHRVTGDPPRRNENSPSSDDTKLEQNRASFSM